MMGAQIIKAIDRGGQCVASNGAVSQSFEFIKPMAALKTCCFAQLRIKVGTYLRFLVMIMLFLRGQYANELLRSLFYIRETCMLLKCCWKVPLK